jgi:hypothetical protein
MQAPGGEREFDGIGEVELVCFLFCFESSFITRLVHSESSMKPLPRNQNLVRYLEGINCGTLEVELVDDALAEDCRDQVWLRNVFANHTPPLTEQRVSHLHMMSRAAGEGMRTSKSVMGQRHVVEAVSKRHECWVVIGCMSGKAPTVFSDHLYNTFPICCTFSHLSTANFGPRQRTSAIP